ncbi:aquaporin [Epidermidibacterium keratini]|uniref:Aquaporin n=1 Tax=Epidermidibacterium keratini TaxID=1891644 RepID=A0A7L4YPF0_9ACTN|nr:aquaporin [Epidermidibacterium keratini]QHC00773.1 aquaporin [Epidermidibacterium keratini]
MAEADRSTSAWRSYVAEFIGTLVLVLGGVGAAVLAGPYIGNVGIAAAFGVTLLFLVYAIGPISGCHVNPAVTAGLVITGKIALKDAIFYVIAQCLGAIAGAAIVLGIASGNPTYDRAVDGVGSNGFGANSPTGFSFGSVFAAEVALTFILVFVVLAATDRIGTAALAGTAIGGALGVIHLIGIPISGTSVNPARSLGSAVFSGGEAMAQLWVFIVAPLIGGVVGALVYNIVFGQDEIEGEGGLNVDGRGDEDPLDRSPERFVGVDSDPTTPGHDTPPPARGSSPTA